MCQRQRYDFRGKLIFRGFYTLVEMKLWWDIVLGKLYIGGVEKNGTERSMEKI